MNGSSTHSAAAKLSLVQILVVISSARAAGLIRNVFHELGFRNIHIAADAAEAIHLLRTLRVHLIVTDSELKIMPAQGEADAVPLDLNGIDFVQRLRHAPQSPAPFTPVLMLMDSARSDRVVDARDAGVNEVVLRPMQARDLCERILQLIDHPRLFITASNYKGPCRRRKSKRAAAETPPPHNEKERRTREIRLVRCEEMKGFCT